MALAQGQLSNTAGTIYTSTGNSAVTTMYICNPTAGAETFWVYLTATAGTSAADSNTIYSNVQVAAGDTYIIDTERLVLGNGETVKAKAGNASVLTMTISYVGV